MKIRSAIRRRIWVRNEILQDRMRSNKVVSTLSPMINAATNMATPEPDRTATAMVLRIDGSSWSFASRTYTSMTSVAFQQGYLSFWLSSIYVVGIVSLTDSKATFKRLIFGRLTR